MRDNRLQDAIKNIEKSEQTSKTIFPVWPVFARRWFSCFGIRVQILTSFENGYGAGRVRLGIAETHSKNVNRAVAGRELRFIVEVSGYSIYTPLFIPTPLTEVCHTTAIQQLGQFFKRI